MISGTSISANWVIRRVIVIAVAWIGLAAAPLWAQAPRHSLRLNGWGGFGFNYTNIGSGDGRLVTSNSRDLISELGLDASGFLYDPRLMNYSFSTFWDRNSTGVDQGSASANGLNFNGSLSFLPERSFPFSVYFSRGTSDQSGSLIPPFTTRTSQWGLRGQLKQPKLAYISYNLGFGSTSNDLFPNLVFDSKQRFANVTAQRRLVGWDMRFSEDYARTTSTYSDYLERDNTLSAAASRALGNNARVDLGVGYSAFKFGTLTGANSSKSDVLLANGSLQWRVTSKLDTSFNASINHNAVNALRILSSQGGPSAPLPFNAQAVDTTSESFAASSNYRATKNLSLTAGLSYSHNSLPLATLSTLPPSTLDFFTTSSLSPNVGYNYRHKIWKFEYRGASSVNWQRFALASGRSDSGFGFSLDNGIYGGSVRRLRYGAAYRYSQRSNPIFFNLATSSDHHVRLNAETSHFRGLTLQAIAEIGKTSLDLTSSHLTLDLRNYMVSATMRQLSVYGSHSTANSDQLLFGLASPLAEPRIPAENQPVAAGQPFNPLILSQVASDRVGVVWRPRINLQIGGGYWQSNYDFAFLQQTRNEFRQLDFTVQYKFGRFTMYAGYGRANSQAKQFNQHANRVIFRIRFPFHIL
jgi:hypothetical protein